MSHSPRVFELEQAVALDPNRRSLRLRLANAYIDEGCPDQALEQVRCVLSSRPSDVEALGIGAMAAALAGDPLGSDAFVGALSVAQRVGGPSVVQRSDSLASVSSDLDVVVPLISLADVDGMFDEKHRLELAVVRPFRMRNAPKSARGAGLELASGTLLFGPKHVSKSYLGHALAGEMHCNIIALDLSAIADPWGTPSAGVITEAFRLAAEHAPCLVFLDNVEAISHRRLRYVPEGRERMAELEEALDGHDPNRVIVVGATSMPWMVPSGLRRPGRFSRMVLVGPPDLEARTATLQRYFRNRMITVSADLRQIAASAEGCTNHDLRTIGAVAAALTLAAMADGGPVPVVGIPELIQAQSVLSRSGWDWFDMAYNCPEFTDDSSEFDPMFDYIRRHIRRVG